LTFTFYPKALLATAVFLVMFGATVALAVDLRRGLAAAGVLSIAAYLLVELLTSSIRLSGGASAATGTIDSKAARHEPRPAMDDAINGQILPALGQWQGAILIAIALVAGWASRRLQGDHRRRV
jgi:hypothetical protein